MSTGDNSDGINSGQCCFTMRAPKTAPAALVRNGRIPCNRKPVWFIGGIGYLCPFHGEHVMLNQMPDPKHVYRLSDNDHDFAMKTEPGMGHNNHTNHTTQRAK